MGGVRPVRSAITGAAGVTPLSFEYKLLHAARARRRRSVLPEGTDERILRATEILLIILGFGLIATELFLTPGTFVAGILGVLSVIAGIVLSFQSFAVPTTDRSSSTSVSENITKVGPYICSRAMAIAWVWPSISSCT